MRQQQCAEHNRGSTMGQSLKGGNDWAASHPVKFSFLVLTPCFIVESIYRRDVTHVICLAVAAFRLRRNREFRS